MIKTCFYISDLESWTDCIEVPFRFQKDDAICLHEIFDLACVYGFNEEGCINYDLIKRDLHSYMIENKWHSCSMISFGFEEGKFTQNVWLSEC